MSVVKRLWEKEHLPKLPLLDKKGLTPCCDSEPVLEYEKVYRCDLCGCAYRKRRKTDD